MALLCTSCSSTDHAADQTTEQIRLPPTAAQASYQIGGSYPPKPGVGIVIRDRADSPDSERYSICYVNAYQTQPEERTWWTTHHPDLLLRDAGGRLVIDSEWNEPLLDIRTPVLRQRVATVVGGWMKDCADQGYRGVELDNLDSFSRSHGLVDAEHALAFAKRLTAIGHRHGLAVGQKNAAELSERGRAAGFDFAVAEECQAEGDGPDGECDDYTAVYGKRLIEIEYTDNDDGAFAAACARRSRTASVSLRDRGVLPAGRSGHVERWCPQGS